MMTAPMTAYAELQVTSNYSFLRGSSHPDELVLAAYPIGTEDMVRERLRAYRDSGVQCLRIGTPGRTTAERIENLERTAHLVQSID